MVVFRRIFFLCCVFAQDDTLQFTLQRYGNGFLEMSVNIPIGTMQYADLNIRHMGNPKQTVAMVKRAILMGFDAIAINIDVGDIVAADNPVYCFSITLCVPGIKFSKY